MSGPLKVQAVVLTSSAVGEYDKRLVLLTRERGKISVFARGAKRPGSPFMAAANPFVFGDFLLYEGRSSYRLEQVSIRHHFTDLAALQPGIYYGYYFLEIADYFGQEGTDEKEMMNLLYVAAKALTAQSMDQRLIRCCFELRTMAIQGMAPRLYDCGGCQRQIGQEEAFFSRNAHGLICPECARRYRSGGETRSDLRKVSVLGLSAMRYIVSAPLTRLFGFTLPEEVLWELEGCIHPYLLAAVDRTLKSLKILEAMAGV